MKYVLVLFTTLLLSSTAFSQAGTVSLSYPVAKLVAADLISYDSTKTALEITTNVLKLTENKSKIKDSVIKSQEYKSGLYKQQIMSYEMKEESYQDIITILKTDLAKQKIKTNIATGLGGVVIASMAMILILSTH